jgi:hypothetical protein
VGGAAEEAMAEAVMVVEMVVVKVAEAMSVSLQRRQ